MTVASLGLPRMHKEAGERRDFLPDLVAGVADLGGSVVVERGIGRRIGYTDDDYLRAGPNVVVGSNEDAFDQDVVLVLRAPEERLGLMRPGATLVSMLHFPTRPQRVARLCELGLDAVSLDTLTDDIGHRLVVDGRDVAWNGLEAAFDVLEREWRYFLDPTRPPVRVTVLGAGAIGKDAVEAATKYGNLERAERLAGFPGVEVTTIGRNLTARDGYMKGRFAATDVLVDATQRHDPSAPVVPNAWLAYLPVHAVICDLVVDPYLLHEFPPTVRGIEGIPQGNLDRWTFAPDDPAWNTVPEEVDRSQRRRVVSCYSWPGVHPHACMELYGRQLAPLLRELVRVGGAGQLTGCGEFHERALWRASLRAWVGQHAALV
ncbi:MAG TPA: alanine dehydrogenase [Actinomycetota bacterium]|nr:alanine dehydrogenase [Actinomycetota bacterium]